MRQLLEALLPAIRRIDGGCSSCIREFVTEANEALAKQGIEERYFRAWWHDHDVILLSPDEVPPQEPSREVAPLPPVTPEERNAAWVDAMRSRKEDLKNNLSIGSSLLSHLRKRDP